MQTILLGIVNDALDEPDETFTLNLSSALGATLSVVSSSVVTIVDDDPLPAIAIQNATVVEGTGSASTLRFFVSLSAASGRAVTVSFATANRAPTPLPMSPRRPARSGLRPGCSHKQSMSQLWRTRRQNPTK